MGGIYQLVTVLLPISVAILAGLILVAFCIGRFFPNKKTRKRIVLAAIGAYLLALTCYLGYVAFLFSGNLNRN